MRNELFPLGLEKLNLVSLFCGLICRGAGTPNWTRVRRRLIKETARFSEANGHHGVYRYRVYHE